MPNLIVRVGRSENLFLPYGRNYYASLKQYRLLILTNYRRIWPLTMIITSMAVTERETSLCGHRLLACPHK